jgi:hypothetical protein
MKTGDSNGAWKMAEPIKKQVFYCYWGTFYQLFKPPEDLEQQMLACIQNSFNQQETNVCKMSFEILWGIKREQTTINGYSKPARK